jgi:CBS domain-containing protein/mannitol/fructose-specific phosphotransferase system IIA component (Ntr-type)
MRLIDLLPPERVLVPLGASTLREALDVLIGRLAAQGIIADPAARNRLLTAARLRDVVAIDPYVALPHFRTDAVERLVVALGVAPAPLAARDLGLDLAPQIVVLILAPPGAATLYLQTVAALARLFRQEGVVDRVRAVRRADDVLALPELRDLKVQPRLAVRDLMSHPVRTVSPETPVREAVDLMVRERVRAIPVVGEKREVLGIISEWDIMRALLPHIPRAGTEGDGERVIIPGELRVRDIMSRSVLCISEEMGIDEVANTMINKDVEQFPVVSEGRLTGFLTRGDIIRKLFGR